MICIAGSVKPAEFRHNFTHLEFTPSLLIRRWKWSVNKSYGEFLWPPSGRPPPPQDAAVTPRVQFGHPVTGRKARKPSVAMAVPPERRRMFWRPGQMPLTSFHWLKTPRLLSFTACCASQSSPLLSVTPAAPSLQASRPVPIPARLRFVSKNKGGGGRRV